MVETEGPCARAHALPAFLQGGSRSFEIYKIEMIVIVRNWIRVFLLARNETGHLPIPTFTAHTAQEPTDDQKMCRGA